MEIARLALVEGAANLSQVARQLNRAPTTLSGLLRDGR
jgi:transposase-like protein